MAVVRVTFPGPQPQLAVGVQAGEAPVRVVEVLQVLLRRRARGVVEGGREVRWLEVRLRQLVLHGWAVVQAPGASVVRPGAPGAVSRRAAAQRKGPVAARRQAFLQQHAELAAGTINMPRIGASVRGSIPILRGGAIF